MLLNFKRGLPHCYMLMVLDYNSKLRDSHDIDAIISAEMPDERKDPQLYQTIISCMIHDPCGIHNPKSVCMEKSVCSKGYPKMFNSETKFSVNGYPEYRQCNDGCKALKHGIVMDNRYVHIA